MFGLEGQKKKKILEEFVIELENDFKNPVKRKEIQQKIETRLQKIKEILRSGDSQEQFDRLGVLLQGYNSILKVMVRCTTKEKKDDPQERNAKRG